YTRKRLQVFKSPTHGDLSKWARQGVLLLNTCLTVAPHQPGSHQEIWNGMLRRVLTAADRVNPQCIYLLWGRRAQDIADMLSQQSIKLMASHPSPMGAYRASKDIPAFIGCGHFRKVNEYLESRGSQPIDWTLD